MKKHLFLKSLLIAIGLLMTCINTAWAGTYYYSGEGNGTNWTKTAMTVSTDKLYEYYQVTSTTTHKFKIGTSSDQWAYNYTYVSSGFNSTNVTEIGDYGSDNCYCWKGSSHYILVYYPNTPINTTANPKICASTTLPSNKFTVTYNANGGSGTTASNTNVIYNTSTTLKANGFTAPSGYHFVGWNTASDYSGTNYAAGASYTVTNNVTLYAKWAKTIYVYNAVSWGAMKLYTWNSERNGGWSGNTTGVTSLGSSWYQIDILSGAANFVLNNGSDGNDNKTADQTTSSFTDGRSYYINNSTSPRGLTEKTLTVSFNMKSHGDAVSSQNVYYKGLVTEPSPAPTATGYTFGGWYKESACTNAWNFSSDKVTAATTLYAKWTEITHTVSFANDGNGSTSPSSNQTVGEVTGIAISATPSDGYAFTTWTSSNGGTFASSAAAASNTFYPTANTTLTASFHSTATNTLTVAATTGGSITTPAGGSYADVDDETDYSIVASRSEGYKFTGWTQSGDGEVTFGDASALSTTATFTTLGDVTVTANFAAMSNSLSVSSSTVYAGSSVTLTATRTNHTLNLKYQYKIGSGSWNTIATTSSTSQSYTIPYANTYQTYYFRVVSTDGSTDIESSSQTVNVKGRITIHVKNTNSWASMYLYSWYSDGSDHTTNGAWPGNTGTGINGQSCSVHATGSQWWDVTITQETTYAQKFILNKNGSNNQDKTDNLSLSSFTHDAYYTMSTNASAVQTLSSASEPVAPTLTTTAAGTIRETSAVLGGSTSNIGGDAVVERGYYWSTDKTLSSSNLAVGTKVVVSSATTTSTGAFSNTKSSLTANTKYYFIAYAKNAHNKIGYGSVENFTTLPTYSITVAAGSGGSVNTTSVTAGQYQSSGTITATPSTNYAFVNWTASNNKITIASATSKSTTVKATATGTVTANFADQWNVKGSGTELGSWSEYKGMPNVSSNTFRKSFSLPAKTTYNFKIVKRADAGGADVWYGVDKGKTLTRASNSVTGLEAGGGEDEYITFTTDAAGTYTITYVYNAAVGSMSVTVGYPTAYDITLKTKSFYNESATGTVDSNGGTVSAEDDQGTTIVDGNKVQTGGTVTFTASPKTGYTFEGWFSNADCAEGNKYVDNDNDINISGEGDVTLELSSIGANKIVYAKFAEKMTTVNFAGEHGHVEISSATVTSKKVGKHTTYSLTAVPDDGYYFAGWTRSETPDFAMSGYEEANNPATLSGLGGGQTSGQTLTANFEELEKIFFRNENEATGGKLWDVNKMYVYFNVDWGISGASENGVTTSAGKFAEMNPVVSGSKIFWAYIPRAITTANYTKIAFSDVWMGSSTYPSGLYGEFYQHKGVYRTDYIKHLNMYVPACTKSTTSNKTDYYSNGYWMKYDTQAAQGASYYLKESTGAGELSEFKVSAANGTSIVTTYRFQNTTAKTFYIANAKGTFYKANSNISSVACTDVVMGEGNTGFLVTPTSEGYYTFTIDQSGDTMKISVNYPISAGDYRLDYTHETSKHLYSDIIKPSTTSAVTTTKKSVYINTDDATASLKLQKCSGLDGSANPVWTSGVAISLGNFTEGKGVYEFDIEIDNTGKTDAQDVKSVAVGNVAIYEGPYYIKTDYAPGGWVNYALNELSQNTINFSKSDSKTFDYYHCAWVGDGEKNVKCIIANDYNQQITDTLIGDAVLGDDGGKPRQYLATSANVRFSYNSYTNELKRAYINGSGGWEASFLSMKDMYTDGTHGGSSGSKSITKTNGSALTNDTISFKDKGNWIYQINVKAVENAHVYLSANYKFSSTNHIQDLIGTSSTGKLLIGDGMKEAQPISIIYDFKTNNLIAAWTPAVTAYDTEIDLSSDVLLIHNRQTGGAGDVVNMIDLTGGGSIKDINRIYSALRFQKNDGGGYIGLSGDLSGSTAAEKSANSYYRYNYWISFPYDVTMTDIFGVEGYGSKWRIQYYDGKERASKGWYKGDGTTTFWKTMPMSDDAILNKGEGYVLQLSPSAFKKTGDGSLWALVDEIYLYFPSKANFGTIELNTSSISLASEGYTCTLGLFTDPTQAALGYSHNVTDSYWHVFGIPTFYEAEGTTGSGTYYGEGDDYPDEHTTTNSTFYFYEYANTNSSSKYNEYTATSSSGYTFQPMHAYMIQMMGTLNFTTNSVPKPIAAPRAAEKNNYEMRIELKNNDVVCDQTFVTLRDSAAYDFAFNEDMMKIYNSGKNNIYTYAGVYDVAANILPIESCTINVGVDIATNGYYTFSMPSNFSGEVTLIDRVADTRTNLTFGEYEVYLQKGEINDRFALEINIRKVATAIDGVAGGSLKDGKAHKFIENGVMYILRDGKVYDAQGRQVK